MTSHQFRKQLAEVTKIIGPGADQQALEHEIFTSIRDINRRKNFNKEWSRYFLLTKPQKAAANRADVALHRLQIALKCDDLIERIKGGLPDPEEIQAKRQRISDLLAKRRPKLALNDKPRRYAVRVAARLLERHGLPVVATRAGKFCRLAAVLYGDRNAKFYHDCCDFLTGRKQGSKKSPTRP